MFKKLKFNEISVDIPLIKCWTYVFALIKAYIEPIHKIWEKTSVVEKSREKIINNIKEIKGWTKSKDKNILSQALKKHELEVFIKVKNANGVRSVITFNIIYLRE